MRSKRRRPIGLWILVLLLLGLFVLGLVWLKQSAPPATLVTSPKPQPIPIPVPLPQQKPTPAVPAHKPRFEFYNTLPKQEVRVPEAPTKPPMVPEPVTPNTSDTTTPTSPGTEISRYTLQIGSYTRTADAEKLRAELAFLGIETRIQSVKLNQQTYYRVLSGPYSGRAEVDTLRRQLEANGYPKSLVLRQR